MLGGFFFVICQFLLYMLYYNRKHTLRGKKQLSLQKRVFLSLLLSFGFVASAWALTANELLETGVDALLDKNPQAAIPYLNQALVKDPKLTRAYLCRAGAYEALNNNTAAFQDYDKAVKVDPHYANSYELRGYLHYRLGHFKEAKVDLNHAQKWFKKVKDKDSLKRVAFTQRLIEKRLAKAKIQEQLLQKKTST